MDLTLQAFGVEDAERRLNLLGARASAPEVFELWLDLLGDLISAERRLFASERGWKDIKTSTVQRKGRDRDPRVRANNYKTLRATGELERILTTRGQGAQPLQFDPDGVAVGVPRGSSRSHVARFQKDAGRNPMVSKAVVRRFAAPRVRDFLLGGDA